MSVITGPVRVEHDGEVAVILMDDRKANALSFEMIEALADALRETTHASKAVVVAGRPGFLSAGLDLAVVRSGDPDRLRQLMASSSRNWRTVLEARVPVVAACTGHALAAGGILLLAADYRVGLRGSFKIGLTETSIGVPMPILGVRMAELRLSRQHVLATTALAQLCDPDRAVEVGFLDEVVDGNVVERAVERAHQFSELDCKAFAETKGLVLRHLLDVHLGGDVWATK